MGTVVNEGEIQFKQKMTDDALLAFFRASKEASEAHMADWRKKIPGLFNMYAGRTLTEGDKEYLRDTNRPDIEFNYTLGVINAILGQDMGNKSEIVFRGTDMSLLDQWKADRATQVVRYQLQRCKALIQEWDAAQETLISGYGWVNIHLNVNRVPFRGSLKRVHCWEMYPDPDATEDNLTDQRWVLRRRRWTQEEAQARWPKHAEELRSSDTSGPLSQHNQVQVRGRWSKMAGVGQTERIDVFEFQYKRYVPHVRHEDPETGEWVDTEEAEFKKLQKELRDTGVELQGYHYAKECYYQAFISESAGGHGLVLEHEKMSIDSFTYSCATGFKDKDPSEGRVHFFGLATVLEDAQHYINRTVRLILDIVATSSKGGGFIEERALTTSPNEFQKNMSKPGFWTVVQTGSLQSGSILERKQQAIPAAAKDLFQILGDVIPELTGVTDYLKGTATQERSEVLISNLQQQSVTMMLPVLEPLNAFRVNNGLVLTKVILRHLPVTDLDRIIGDEQFEDVTFTIVPNEETGEEEQTPITDQVTGHPVTAGSLLKQSGVEEFDITADIGQASATMKLSVWQVLAQSKFFEQMSAAGMDMALVMKTFMKYLPLPADATKEIADALEEQAGGMIPADPESITEALMQMPGDQAAQIIEQVSTQIQQSQMQQLPQQGAAF